MKEERHEVKSRRQGFVETSVQLKKNEKEKNCRRGEGQKESDTQGRNKLLIKSFASAHSKDLKKALKESMTCVKVILME